MTSGQSRTRSARILRTDNRGFYTKIVLRRRFTEAIERVPVYLPACGCGVMFEQVWRAKATYVLALDMLQEKISHLRFHHPDVDARVADINSFCDWPVNVRFAIADFDVYGSPYRGIKNFLDSRAWSSPLYVTVTDGLPCWLGRGGLLPRELVREGHAVRVKDTAARRKYFDAIVWPWWEGAARANGLAVHEHVVLWKKGKRVAYYALRLSNERRRRPD